MELQAANLGAVHPTTLGSMREVAKSLDALRDYAAPANTWHKLVELRSLTRSAVNESSFIEDLQALTRAAEHQNAQLLEAGELTQATREIQSHLQLVREQSDENRMPSFDLLCVLAETKAKANEYADAATTYREALKVLAASDSDDTMKLTQANGGLAVALAELGKIDESKTLFYETLESSASASSKVSARISLAKILVSEGSDLEFVEAANLLESGFESEITFDQRQRLALELGELSRLQGQTVMAMAWEGKAAAATGDIDQANQILNNLKLNPEADSQFSAIEKSVVNEIQRNVLAQLASDQEYAECLESLQQLVTLEPENLTFKVQLALVHAYREERKAFFEVCDQLLDSTKHLESPVEQAKFAHVGLLLDDKGAWSRTSEAIGICREAFELDDTNGELALYAGLAEIRAGQFDEASKILGVVLRESPSPLLKGVAMSATSVRSALAG